ncbi:MAG: transcription antitermination factor NusB [Bacteroidetes bacterium]|nr:transcription antitermination factor NusB [Bacteroidota bacterium]MDA0879843.1 transcription antitermination factor NusB [Bacteroidota bacterium]MDA1115831.1 transcription antitermination factor NusB [Bacteroidota bacterium]
MSKNQQSLLTRRHIRTKVMQLLFANSEGEQANLVAVKSLLKESMLGVYDFYLLQLALFVGIHKKASRQLQFYEQKHILQDQERMMCENLVNNRILNHIVTNEFLEEEMRRRHIDLWKNYPEYIDLVFKAIWTDKEFSSQSCVKKPDFEADRLQMTALFKNVIAPNEKLHDFFSDHRLTWDVDLPVVNSLLLKRLAKVKDPIAPDYFMVDIFNDHEDEQFAIDLMTKTILNGNAYQEEVSKKTENWDQERIARLDMVLLQMAICEFKEFPQLPVFVTIDEYIELAKEFSTPKSSIFVNGILDKIIKEYMASNELNKIGRGLL